MELLGYDLAKDTWAPDEPISLTLYWRALAAMSTEYQTFVHLLNADGTVVSQSDAAPAGWTRPTTGWLPGEVITDAHTLPPTAARVAGRYRIAVGMYDPRTMTRLEMRTATEERVPDDAAVLTEITIQ